MKLNTFYNTLRRRLFRREILYAMLLSFFIMIISFLVEASLEIRTLLQDIHDLDLYYPELGLFSTEAAERLKTYLLENSVSQAFSFFIFMEDGYIIYNFIANFIITLPILMFFEDRQNGTEQLIALRTGTGSYLVLEATAICLTVGVLVLVPSILFWGITYLFAPYKFPLSQSFVPDSISFFQILGLEKNVAWKYLALIILNSMMLMSKAFLTFTLSLRIHKKAVILFIPILFSYAFQTICIMLGCSDYGKISYFDSMIKTLAPMFVSMIIPLLLSAGILYLTNVKERSLNE